jgi:hypothetical protein
MIFLNLLINCSCDFQLCNAYLIIVIAQFKTNDAKQLVFSVIVYHIMLGILAYFNCEYNGLS